MADSCISDMQMCWKLILNLLLKTVNSCSDDLYANTLPYTHSSLKSKLPYNLLVRAKDKVQHSSLCYFTATKISCLCHQRYIYDSAQTPPDLQVLFHILQAESVVAFTWMISKNCAWEKTLDHPA